VGVSRVFHKEIPETWPISSLRIFTPDGERIERLLLTFEGSSLVSRARPSLPRVARLEHQACGLVFVYPAAVFVAAVYGEAVPHTL